MADEVNRGTDEHFKAGGKGLNVSRILSLLGVRSRAVALLGGFTGQFIIDSFRDDENVEILPVWVDGNNRINLKASHGDESLVINGTGPSAGQEETGNPLRVPVFSVYAVREGSVQRAYLI